MPSPLKLVQWSKDFAESLGRPEAAKFVYDWANATGGVPTSPSELQRLERAVKQGFNAVGFRYSNPARDEAHLRRMMLEPERLADESRAFHVDLTPGAPGAKQRAEMSRQPGELRPLALRLGRDLVRGTDEQANLTGFLNRAAERGSSGVQYSPTGGELANLQGVYGATNVGPSGMPKGYEFTRAPNYQPAVAMLDPTAVRDLRTAQFSPDATRKVLAAGAAAGTTSLLQAAPQRSEKSRNAENRDMANDVPITGTITPMRQQPALGAIAAALRKAQQFAGQYEIDKRIPLLGGTSVDELLSLPGAASLMEDVSYFGPSAVIRGGNAATGGIGTFRLDPRVADVADVGMNVTPLAVLAGKGTAKGVKALENATVGAAQRARIRSAAAKVPEDTAYEPLRQRMEERGNLAYAVKPKGGNWASGSVEGMIDKLKTTDSNMMQLLRNGDPRFVDQALLSRLETNSATIDNWLETKLSKYVKNEMATPEDPLRLQADEFAGRKAKLLAEKDKQLEKATADLERAQAERGVPPEVLTRSQARIRELRRERDYIEAQRGLHFEPPGDQARRAKVKREQAGMPTEPTANTDVGTAWENTADAVTMTAPYRDLVNMYDGRAMPDKLRELGGEFAVKNPGARAHQIDSGASPSDLGLYHMTDELMNALDPASGLPEKLMLTPDKLQKMSVAQVAKHVDDINAWRAVQTKEANAARAANAATSVVKEYPDEGLRWVELKLPEKVDLPEGYSVVEDRPGFRLKSPEGKLIAYGDSPEEAVRGFFGKKTLEDALKYEGEMLSHCVGGYCDRVLSGKSRIMSLRDAEGRPRVTVELQPARQSKHPLYSRYMDEVVKPGGEYAEQYLEAVPWGNTTHTRVLSDKIDADFPKWLESTHPERLGELKSLPPPVIQIKAKGNKLAGEEDIPYVLDFLNSQPFDYVNDLPRGIIDIKEYSGSLADTAQELFNKRFLTKQEMDKARRLDKKRTQQAPGFASGGLVRFDPDEIQHLAGQFTDQFTPGYAAGGLVKYDPAEIDTIVSEMKEAFHG